MTKNEKRLQELTWLEDDLPQWWPCETSVSGNEVTLIWQFKRLRKFMERAVANNNEVKLLEEYLGKVDYENLMRKAMKHNRDTAVAEDEAFMKSLKKKAV
jgi:hypothetical protein